MKPEDLLLGDDEIHPLMAPFMTGETMGTRDLLLARSKLTLHFLLRRLAPEDRDVTYVQENYDEVWSNRSFEVFSPKGRSLSTLMWQGTAFEANPIVVKRVYIAQLMKIIDVLQPRSILEIGCGQGVNLAVLSRAYSDIRFGGLELTRAGARWAERLGSERLPAPLQEFSPVELPERPPAAPEITCGSAADLPYEDDSFDLIYSVLALEQMESVREKVLREIQRVARHHVCMFEPFTEWNESLLERSRIKAKGYWRGNLADLPDYGLDPVIDRCDLPRKLSMGVGFVLCNVSSPART